MGKLHFKPYFVYLKKKRGEKYCTKKGRFRRGKLEEKEHVNEREGREKRRGNRNMFVSLRDLPLHLLNYLF